jgi:hypothetical protein
LALRDFWRFARRKIFTVSVSHGVYFWKIPRRGMEETRKGDQTITAFPISKALQTRQALDQLNRTSVVCSPARRLAWPMEIKTVILT